MRESDLTKRIKAALEKRGGFWFKVHGGPFQLAGLPDILGCYRGRFVGIEVKLPGKERTLTPLQSKMLERIDAAGGVAAMVTSVDQALDVLKLIDE